MSTGVPGPSSTVGGPANPPHRTGPRRCHPDPTPILLRGSNGGTTRAPPRCRIRPATSRRPAAAVSFARPVNDPVQVGGAHEGRCRQGDRARRAARRPGTRSARQAQGGRAGDPRRTRRRRRFVHPRCRLRGRRRDDRLDRRALRRCRRRAARRQAVRGGGRAPALRPGRHRLPGAAHRSGPRSHARQGRRDRDQPRRHPAHAVARPDDGRPLVAGQRRRLQGGPHRGQRVRPLLPAADDRRRHGQAGQRPDPGHRRRRPPGDRHGQAPRRRGQGLRRPPGDARAGRVARAPSSSSSRRPSTRPAPAATPAS